MTAGRICAEFLNPIGDTIAVGLCLSRSFAVGEDGGATRKLSMADDVRVIAFCELAKKGKEEWNRQIVDRVKEDECKFIDFRNAEIPATVSFAGFCFPIGVDFSGTKFLSEETNGRPELNSDFSGATFEGEARFRNAEFHIGVSFHRAKFKHFAIFDGAEFSGAAYFNGATFHKAPLFKTENLHGNVRFNHARFLDFDGDHAIANYRELKLAMKSIDSHAEEHIFFRLEMLARKHDERNKISKRLYQFYEFISDYGQSISCPLHCLFRLAVILFPFYWVLLWRFDLNSLLCALQVAVRSALPFPGIFPDGFGELQGWRSIVVAVHRLASASLWFLALLAIRNRFRLK